ncbi:hypothetical protein ACO2Q2_09710 [Dyella sp. KRB-257]|uniref:hypothetical protein n=1 Tax=Dyella sp. KRB-257 TaxID=3400915 RepID=UPI003BFFF728
MDGSSKIALGIIGAAVVGVAGFVGYNEYSRQRDLRDLMDFVGGVQSSAQEMQQSAAMDAAQASARAAARRDALQRSRMLSPVERCIAGTVVTVSGSTYTQATGSDGRPVACSGRYRLR